MDFGALPGTYLFKNATLGGYPLSKFGNINVIFSRSTVHDETTMAIR